MRKHIVYEKKIEINLMQKLIKKMKSVTGFRNIVYNVNGTCYERNCLISYIKKPFESGPSNTHQNGIQVLEIDRLIGEY